ncbi:MAG: hypothetical protein ACRDGM_07415 [bacterium]
MIRRRQQHGVSRIQGELGRDAPAPQMADFPAAFVVRMDALERESCGAILMLISRPDRVSKRAVAFVLLIMLLGLGGAGWFWTGSPEQRRLPASTLSGTDDAGVSPYDGQCVCVAVSSAGGIVRAAHPN